jgi:hypothetical protein
MADLTLADWLLIGLLSLAVGIVVVLFWFGDEGDKR